MSVFRNVIFVAALAGLLAGLAMAVMQSYATTPLILQAETFENASSAPGSAAPAGAHHGHGNLIQSTHEAEHEAWAPRDGFERTAYTALANVVTAIGFAILLGALAEFSGGLDGWRRGMIWGFAGFAAFTLAPGLGLPPELPTMPAADLLARQTWWLATVTATAAGLALIAFSKNSLLAVVGVALMIAPHLIGAPQPVSHATPIPHDLHRQFVVMTTLTSLVFWLLLGGLSGFFRARFTAATEQKRVSLA